MSKPTPGPWTLEQDGSLVIGGQVILQPRDAGPDGASIDEKKANLRLMAAAPDLLDALKDICIAFRDGGSHVERVAALVGVEKAIAKAQGRDK